MALTKMFVWLTPLAGLGCSFNTTDPRPDNAMVVLGAGFAEMLVPATTRLTKVAPALLEALVAVALLVAVAVTVSAVIKLDRMLTDWTDELAVTEAAVAVWLLVTVSVS